VKLATVIGPDGLPQIGALIHEDKAIALLQAGLVALEGAPNPNFTSMLSFLQDGAEAQYKAYVVQDFVASQGPDGTVMPVSSTTFLSPVPVPESIRDAMVFEQHIINSIRTVGLGPFAKIDEMLEKWFGRRRSLAYRLNKAWYERPIYYKSNRFSVVGHGAVVCIPAYTKQFDYELEWGIIIGKGGRDIPLATARDHIMSMTWRIPANPFFSNRAAENRAAVEIEVSGRAVNLLCPSSLANFCADFSPSTRVQGTLMFWNSTPPHSTKMTAIFLCGPVSMARSTWRSRNAST